MVIFRGGDLKILAVNVIQGGLLTSGYCEDVSL